MKKFIKSTFGKVVLYTMIVIATYVLSWALIGWVLYDFSYLSWDGIRLGVFIQFAYTGVAAYLVASWVDIRVYMW